VQFVFRYILLDDPATAVWICSFPLNYGIYDLHGFRGWRHVEIDDVFEHYLTVSRF
jgi:hypothetical protein